MVSLQQLGKDGEKGRRRSRSRTSGSISSVELRAASPGSAASPTSGRRHSRVPSYVPPDLEPEIEVEDEEGDEDNMNMKAIDAELSNLGSGIPISPSDDAHPGKAVPLVPVVDEAEVLATPHVHPALAPPLEDDNELNLLQAPGDGSATASSSSLSRKTSPSGSFVNNNAGNGGIGKPTPSTSPESAGIMNTSMKLERQTSRSGSAREMVRNKGSSIWKKVKSAAASGSLKSSAAPSPIVAPTSPRLRPIGVTSNAAAPTMGARSISSATMKNSGSGGTVRPEIGLEDRKMSFSATRAALKSWRGSNNN